jgi:protein subunit release factor B
MPERELLFSVTLADCVVQTFRCGGNGGQNVNKRDTGVRITHRESRAVGQSCDERSQLQNKKRAFRRMAESKLFQAWLARQSHEYKQMQVRAEKWAEAQVQDPALLKVEVFDGRRWGLDVAGGNDAGATA